eukprot:3511140-Pyramimonas_sp.AAC.1
MYGALEFLVLPRARPPLMPAELWGFLGAVVNAKDNVITFGKSGEHEIPMAGLPSGHRSIALIGRPSAQSKLGPALET